MPGIPLLQVGEDVKSSPDGGLAVVPNNRRGCQQCYSALLVATSKNRLDVKTTSLLSSRPDSASWISV